MNWPGRYALLLCLGLASQAGLADTLYQWSDEAGEARIGYRPPPGVAGNVLVDRNRTSAEPADCRALEQQHLQIIDKEVERLRHLPTGMGAEFEFTAESKQRFINDLLAHRAAFITGKPLQQFQRAENRRVFNPSSDNKQPDQVKLMDELQTQARQLKQQRRELERQRAQYNLPRPPDPSLYPRLIEPRP